jgi:hypothetical protein
MFRGWATKRRAVRKSIVFFIAMTDVHIIHNISRDMLVDGLVQDIASVLDRAADGLGWQSHVFECVVT